MLYTLAHRGLNDTARLMFLVVLTALALMLTGNVAHAARTKNLTLEINKGEMVRLSQSASTVFVANPAVANVQLQNSRVLVVYGKAPGNTTVMAMTENGTVLASLNVVVTHGLDKLGESVRALHPDTKDVTFTSVNGSIVARGKVANSLVAADIAGLAAEFVGEGGKFINQLDVTSPIQVRLEVKVAEINRSVQRQLGINWAGAFDLGGDAAIAFSTLGASTLAGPASGFVAGGYSNGGTTVGGLLRALETDGLAYILAEPNLTALSGETANFLAGGEFPILVPQGNQQTTVEFKKFGVSLAFTPTITSKNQINLHVRPEVSKLSDEGAVSVPLGIAGGLFGGDTVSIPALKVRRAETTVELGSGQSFAIGGLLSNDSMQGSEKLPFLGSLPIIGRLFSSDSFKQNQSELVIVVTPYLVDPTSGKLPLPTDGFVAPNEGQKLVTGGQWNQTQPGQSQTLTQPAPVVTPEPAAATGGPRELSPAEAASLRAVSGPRHDN